MDYQTGYAHYLTEEKHASDNTLSSYLRDVNQFLRWLAGEGLLPELAEQRDVEAYTRFLAAKGKSAATVTRSLASLKSFYTYLMGEGLVAVNPAKNSIPKPLMTNCTTMLPTAMMAFCRAMGNPSFSSSQESCRPGRRSSRRTWMKWMRRTFK